MPDPDAFSNFDEAAVILAVEADWVAEVRRLVADQDGLIKRVLDAFEEETQGPQ